MFERATMVACLVFRPPLHRKLHARVTERLNAQFKPRPRLSVSEWADRHRVLSAESCPEPGQWSTDRVPYLREIMDAFSDPTVRRVVFMKCAQVGFTECVSNVVGYFMDQDPSPILVVQPSIKPMAETWSKDRLAPMIRDTPRLRNKVRDPRSRDSGNTVAHKVFPGGHVTVTGANSPAGLASRPIRVVLFDEVDRYPPSAGTEGDPVKLGENRTAAFWNRKIGLGSSPGIKGDSRIEKAFSESDQRYYHVPCPHCGHYQRLEWARLKWRDRNPRTAAYECESCEQLIEEKYKQKMLRQGRWVSENPEHPDAGFHLNALYSPFATWPEIVEEFLTARGNPQLMKAFVNLKLGQTWQESGEELDHEVLLSRREPYAAEVPKGVGVLTAGVDVQGDRLEYSVWGWGAGEEAWLIKHEALWGDPVKMEVWGLLDLVLTRAWQHESGPELRIRSMCVDSGGLHTDEVYRYCKSRERHGVYAVKGKSQPGSAAVGKPSRSNKANIPLFPLGTEALKDTIFACLKTDTIGPRYIHFPDGLSPDYFRQLTAEVVRTRWVKGRSFRRYEKKQHERNEALDCTVYARAALIILGPVRDQLGLIVEAVQKGKVPQAVSARPRRRVRSSGVTR